MGRGSIEDQIISEARRVAPHIKATLEGYRRLEEFDEETLKRIDKLQRMYELVNALEEKVDSLVLTELYGLIVSEVSGW